jgi:hypothetical protein
MKPWPRERLAFRGLTLKEGETYKNGHGDLRGPLRQIGDTFLDQYGCVYRANGHQHSHHVDSAGNLFAKDGNSDGRKA